MNNFTKYLAIIFQITGIAYGQLLPSKTTGVKQLAHAVELNPENLKAHYAFISKFDINDPSLSKQYDIWMKRFPKSAIIPFAIGKEFNDQNDLRAKSYLSEAVKIKPDFAEAWACLSLNAYLSGDLPTAIKYIDQATRIAPKNADYAFRYSFLYKDIDSFKYDSLMTNVVYRFPNSEEGAKALRFLASAPYNTNEKTAYYEALYNLYSKQQSPWFIAGMLDYYDELLNTSPETAFDLALKMVLELKLNRQDWKQRLEVARNLIEAQKFLTDSNYNEALETIKKVKLDNSAMGHKIFADEALVLFKAKILDAEKKTKNAFDTLSAFYVKQPSKKLRNSLLNYGLKVQIDSDKVDSIITEIRNKNASKQVDFASENLITHEKISLSNYRGKIILLTFWFPTCSPCREEFAYFEKVINKINNPNIIYIAVNSFNQQEQLIRPIIKNNNYSFIPLRDSINSNKNSFANIRVFPTNYLIDQNGKIIFSDFQITDKNEDTLELMLTEMLKK